ncbi:GGDEF domain-containing protein [Aliidiomarina celeris]|uniref:GGDEF domain-containing protein n=1 Tax=Aliidiomarina celeris TaxID=2249428 RepID=UPI000DE9B1EC|nr:sensor domain-containing diguanylate cyclase [Aliidiomarina celeris]
MVSDSQGRAQFLAFSFNLLEQMHVGVITQRPPLPLQNGTPPAQATFYANYAAQRLLNLSSSEPTRAELESIHFGIDSELIGAPEQKSPVESPLLSALAGERIERRDLVVNGKPIALHSEQVHRNSEDNLLAANPSATHNAVLLFERDHRLFVHHRSLSDLLNSEISLKDMISFDKLMSQLSTNLINAQGAAAKPHIQQALQALGDFCQADRTYIFEFDDTISTMSNTFEWVREGITSHIDDLQDIAAATLPWFFECIQTEGLFLVHQVEDIPARGVAEKSEFENEDIRSVLCIGMYAQQKLIGVVGCDMVARTRYWTEADIRRLKLVGEIIANAIQNERFIRDLQVTQQELISANQQLNDLAYLDALTGIANRRQFDQALSNEVGRALRNKTQLSLCLIDIDAFKRYNDAYGHVAGDQVLKNVAQLFQNHFRRSGELVARFGGEEFAILVPNKSVAEIEQRIEQLFCALVEQDIEHRASEISPLLTISAGLADLSMLTEPSPEQLVESADIALYNAKHAGRNQFVIFAVEA